MAGGADAGIGDLGMGFDPTGGGGGVPGGGGGGGSDMAFSGDPTLTGDDPMSGMMGAMSGGSPDAAFGGPPGGGSNQTNPLEGAQQSQAPQPGTSPTSFGGQQSAPQTNPQLEQLIKQLSGVHNQASPLEMAAAQGQGYGGGPTGTSTGLQGTAESPAPESTFAQQPGQLGPRGGFGGGSPTAEQPPFTTASNTSQPAPTGAPKGNVPIGATAQPIPPSDSTTPTPPSSTSPGQPTPEEAASIPKVGKTDTTQTKPDTTPAPATTTPTATDPATAGAAPTAPQGSYGGGSPTQQQMNPAKLIGDVVQAMFGNVQPLLQDLAGGQMGSGNWESAGNPPGVPPWAPGYGPQSRIQPGTQPPRQGRAGGQPPAGKGATPEQIKALQQGDVRQQISSGQVDPFGATGWTPENRLGLGPGSSPSPEAAEMVSHASVARSRIAGSDTKPTAGFSNYLRDQRAPQATELAHNARTKLEVAGMLALENAQDPIGPMESLANRSNFYGQSMQHLLHNGFYGPINKGQLQQGIAMYQRDPALRARIDTAMNAVMSGSNVLAGATDQGLPTDKNGRNPSGRVTRGTEVYNDHAPRAANWRRQQQQKVQEELRGGGTGPRSALPPRNRVTGLDLLQGDLVA